jgi:gentisate 1,2-dioxygenase
MANPDRVRFSSELAALDMRPLWERTMRLKPGTAAVPAMWRWQDVRPQLLRAAGLIGMKEAERRVLHLENPALRGTNFVTTTVVAGLQIVLPGEIAPTHRHSPNALRFIVEGEGAYTTVDGERVSMHPGDFVTTPGWTWHDHGNAGPDPVVWLDGLDVPLAQLLGAYFLEDYTQDTQPVSRLEGDAAARYGPGLLPVDYEPEGRALPLLRYPYERTREALERLARSGEPHSSHGFKLRYATPGTGGHPFPTMAAFMQLLPAGFAGSSCRGTDSAVYNVVEGRGKVEIGDSDFAFAPHDIFVVPSWQPHRFSADGECLVFSYSDRAAQEALGFWRVQA